MPELPEVETVRRGLQPHMEGRTLTRVIQRRADLRFPFPRDFVKRLEGRQIERLSRRAKYLLGHLEDGTVLIMHLGMSGRFSIDAPDAGHVPGTFVHIAATHETGTIGPHDHVIFDTDAPARIVFTDHRRFGSMSLAWEDDMNAHPLLRDLGPEPLDPEFTAKALRARLENRRSPIKAALLDQKIVAGLGNIYVCEALHRARISPLRIARDISAPGHKDLVHAIKSVLEDAIESGGSSLRDYVGADGALGYFQHRFRVYGREGEACPRRGCGTIERIVQSNRSTFHCPKCQC